VKASTESHADAGDRVNDDLRVDGEDLRARSYEGGNLGFTNVAVSSSRSEAGGSSRTSSTTPRGSIPPTTR
jgi:NAD-specific glutamate dehydrogenase